MKGRGPTARERRALEAVGNAGRSRCAREFETCSSPRAWLGRHLRAFAGSGVRRCVARPSRPRPRPRCATRRLARRSRCERRERLPARLPSSNPEQQAQERVSRHSWTRTVLVTSILLGRISHRRVQQARRVDTRSSLGGLDDAQVIVHLDALRTRPERVDVLPRSTLRLDAVHPRTDAPKRTESGHFVVVAKRSAHEELAVSVRAPDAQFPR